MRKQRKFNFIKKIFLVIPFILMMSISEIILSSEKIEEPLFEVFWYDIFGRVSAGEVQTLILSIESMGTIFLFALLFGSYISDFFHENSMVVFTRIHNRKQWSIQKIIEIYGLSMIYTILFLVLKFMMSAHKVFFWQMDKQLLWTLLVLFLTMSSLFTNACLVANLVSIKFGIPIAILSVFGVIILLQSFGILYFDSNINVICNPLCFNIKVLYSQNIGMMKILINLCYLILTAVGMTIYISKKDIF